MIKNISRVEVFFQESKVGTIAEEDGRIYFQYEEKWIQEGFSISPFSLPLKSGLFQAKNNNFGGLFGVFSDSLPDGFGTLVVDRYLAKHGINPEEVSLLTRLTLLNDTSLGALEYRPCQSGFSSLEEIVDFDVRRKELDELMENKSPSDLDALYHSSSAAGGSRPKVNILRNNKLWIVKFPAFSDTPESGKREYDYNGIAKKCGLDVPPFALLPSKKTSGYFAEERFDRKDGKRIHRISLSGLLEASPDIPVLDYLHLFKVCQHLGNEEDVLQAYRLMCFNVFAENYDDHGKNFSFLYSPLDHLYHLSPAYDLTTMDYVKPHETTLNGIENPTLEDILSLNMEDYGLRNEECKKIAEEIQSIVKKELKEYLK